MALASLDGLLEHAKDVVHQPGYSCEWAQGAQGKPCGTMLYSWNALKKHITLHTSTVRGNQWAECKLTRCSQRYYRSREELLQHIEETHLSRLSLPCPILGCNNSRVVKVGDLTNHLHEFHSWCTNPTSGKVVKIAPKLQPIYPTLLAPPQLPANPVIGLVQVQPGKRLSRPSQRAVGPVPRHPRQLPMSDIVEERPTVEEEFDDILSFKHLRLSAGVPEQEIVQRYLIIGQPDRGLNQRLGRPAPLLEARPYQPPPRSILFEPFEKRVNAMTSGGTAADL